MYSEQRVDCKQTLFEIFLTFLEFKIACSWRQVLSPWSMCSLWGWQDHILHGVFSLRLHPTGPDIVVCWLSRASLSNHEGRATLTDPDKREPAAQQPPGCDTCITFHVLHPPSRRRQQVTPMIRHPVRLHNVRWLRAPTVRSCVMSCGWSDAAVALIILFLHRWSRES